MAAERVFLDTSLIVAAAVAEHPSHDAAAAYVATFNKRDVRGCISLQVCREFLVALTRRPIGPREFTPSEALAALAPWLSASNVLDENVSVRREFLRLVEERQVRGKAIHDCNIVATMLAHGVKRLATRNAPDFGRYDDIVVENPLVS